MRLDVFGDFGNRRFPVDGKVAAAQLLGDPRPDHVHSEYLSRSAVGVLLGDDLHQAIEFAQDLRAAVGAERMLGNDYFVAGLAGSFLAGADERDFWMAIDGPWHAVVCNRCCHLAANVFGNKDRFRVTNVC